jgi:peptidoglycan hydrolase-like protein with peptidoglycan-binding domain
MEFARGPVRRPGPDRRPATAHGAAGPAVPAIPHAGPMTEASLLSVQQAAGNAATASLLQRQVETTEATSGAATEATAGAATEAAAHRTLRFGSTGDDVKVLQMKLRHVRERMHDRDVSGRARIDGIFGPLTQQDVVDFQTDTGLEADGITGPRTWAALDSLVPETPDPGHEQTMDDSFYKAVDLKRTGQYDAAVSIFESLIASSNTLEMIGPTAANAGACHQQRGRFGLAVARYELALTGRFNQERLRAEVLEDLMLARQNQFRADLPVDPEPLPPGASGGAAAGREGGGVTERQPVKSGDTGPSSDLFKGKLAHLMVGWSPELPNGGEFDAPTAAKTREFQQACGLTQTGDGDASTWHALDSFTRADVPMSVIGPLFDQGRAAIKVSHTDPAASLPLFEALRDRSQGLGLAEVVKNVEQLIGRSHHKLSHFAEAVEHYTAYLDRTIPDPDQYGIVLEHLRRAQQGMPFE